MEKGTIADEHFAEPYQEMDNWKIIPSRKDK
jgi:hypothetical protein